MTPAHDETQRFGRTISGHISFTCETLLEAHRVAVESQTIKLIPDLSVFSKAIRRMVDPSDDWNGGYVTELDRADYFRSLAEFARRQVRFLESIERLVSMLTHPWYPEHLRWAALKLRFQAVKEVWITYADASARLSSLPPIPRN